MIFDQILLILEHLANFLGAERYTQHAICLTNDPLMIALYTISEFITMISYFILGGGLAYSYKRGISFSSQTKFLFGAFIFLCGLQHGTSLLTLYVGVYRLDIIVKCLTAAVSIATAITSIPQLMDDCDPDDPSCDNRKNDPQPA